MNCVFLPFPSFFILIHVYKRYLLFFFLRNWSTGIKFLCSIIICCGKENTPLYPFLQHIQNNYVRKKRNFLLTISGCCLSLYPVLYLLCLMEWVCPRYLSVTLTYVLVPLSNPLLSPSGHISLVDPVLEALCCLEQKEQQGLIAHLTSCHG